jgi:hypothetical protein
VAASRSELSAPESLPAGNLPCLLQVAFVGGTLRYLLIIGIMDGVNMNRGTASRLVRITYEAKSSSTLRLYVLKKLQEELADPHSTCEHFIEASNTSSPHWSKTLSPSTMRSLARPCNGNDFSEEGSHIFVVVWFCEIRRPVNF